MADLSAINGFVRENMVKPLQDSQKANSHTGVKDTDKVKSESEKKITSNSSSPGVTTTDPVKEMLEEELDVTISHLNDSLQNVQRNLEFSIDQEAGRIVINVKDKETDEVLRQIPSEEVLELARNLHNVNIRLNQNISESNDSYSSQVSAGGVFLKISV